MTKRIMRLSSAQHAGQGKYMCLLITFPMSNAKDILEQNLECQTQLYLHSDLSSSWTKECFSANLLAQMWWLTCDKLRFLVISAFNVSSPFLLTSPGQWHLSQGIASGPLFQQLGQRHTETHKYGWNRTWRTSLSVKSTTQDNYFQTIRRHQKMDHLIR